MLPTGRRAPGWRDGAEVVSGSRGGWRRSGCGTVGEGLVRQAAVRSGPGSLRQGERLLPIRCPTACRGRRTACWEETLHSWRTGGRAGSQAATRSVPDAGDWVAPSEPQPAPPSGAPTWFGTRHTPVSGATAPRPHTAGQGTWCRGSAGQRERATRPRRVILAGTPSPRGAATPNTPSLSPPGTEDGVLGGESPQLEHRGGGASAPGDGQARASGGGQASGRAVRGRAGQRAGRCGGRKVSASGGAGEGRPARRAVCVVREGARAGR